jgi:DNA-binding FadR family transcriptional regulator
MDEAVINADVDTFLKADFAFHMAMAESTGNRLIHLIMAPVVNLMRDVQKYHLSNVVQGNQRSQRNHKRIMKGIERHDPDHARLCMYEHIVQVRDDIQRVSPP